MSKSGVFAKRSAAARVLRGGAQRVIPARHSTGHPCLFLSIVVVIMIMVMVMIMVVPVVLVLRAVDLAADLACRELHRMDVRVCRVGAQRFRQWIEVASRDVLRRDRQHIRRCDGAGHRTAVRRAGLHVRHVVIGAEEHHHVAGDVVLAEVDVGLDHRRAQSRVGELEP